ncbi:response regulator transcription factor [Caballeronia sp. EK]|jgi:DNA-binding NarL/FixJ family response regulator|uniref:Response regulator transcription factor n=2 Tax=Caballeronia novacaledonica TaxID=1544861 RepID=A0AA37MGU0_9BURK|nr:MULTISPECIES: response regulator transcription factor [Caballeronia]MBC8635772.1 response regulator transcription factor [Caballeronia sp. EK]GJH25290.1 response regulator transcription factor [Caballeronia novacaledonica]
MTAESVIRVLLVDDHAVVRNGVRLMLGTSDDIEVAGEAQTASDALLLARTQSFDVALVDVALPDRNGLELVRPLRAQQPTLAVLMLSIYAEEVYALRAIKHGAAGYLTKSVSAETLIAAVRKVHSGGKYITASLAERFAQHVGEALGPAHETLSDRELEVLKLIAGGESLANIATTLHLSPNTVTTYRARICQKIGLKSNAQLARYALEHGLLV